MKVPPFISAALQRFFTANPKWAKRLQAISAFVMFIAWLPELAEYLEIPHQVWMDVLHHWSAKVLSLLGIVLLQLPNDEKK